MEPLNQYTTDITIHAPADKVWKVLTDADTIHEYLGVTLQTTWQKGSPVVYRHVYEDTVFEDRGTVLDIVPCKLLVLEYLPALSGLKDTPENYQQVIVELTNLNDITTLTVTQKNIRDEFFGQRAPEIWGEVLRSIKQIAER